MVSFGLFTFVNITGALAKKNSDDAYQSYADIPYFINIENPDITMKKFMQDVLQDMQKRLIQAPRSARYLDKNRNISRKGLENYKILAKIHLENVQKRKFKKLDINKDQVVTIEDISQRFRFNNDNVVGLYNVVTQHGDKAFDKMAPFMNAMKKNKNSRVRPRTFVEDTLSIFITLDTNEDKQLTAEEILYISNDVFDQETLETIIKYESYLSLSENGQNTTLEQVNAAAVKAFNTIDYKKDRIVSRKEFSRYRKETRYLKEDIYRKARNKGCRKPSLGDNPAPIYAAVINGSNATTSLKFNSPFNSMAGHVDVTIEKRNKPINLVLSSFKTMAWSMKGDTSSLDNVLVFGPSYDDEVLSAISGIPKEKVTFMALGTCWKTYISSPNNSDIKNNKNINTSLNMFKSLSGHQLSLLRDTWQASSILVKNTPEIDFSYMHDETMTKPPQGFNKEYWHEFLRLKPYGHKRIDIDDFILASYATIIDILPEWAGFAQLQQDNIISPLHIDHSNKKAVFLLRKNLNVFPPLMSGIAWQITLIKDHNNISYPEITANSLPYCIISGEGEILEGIQTCSSTDIQYLKNDNDKISSVKSPIFLSLNKYIPVMTANKDSIDISVNIDDRLCKKYYGNQYVKKCTLSKDILNSKIPAYAAEFSPNITGTLSWKNNSTLTFNPNEVWKAGARYTFTLDLDLMELPKGIYVNNKRKVTSTFYASEILVRAFNPKVGVHPKFSGINMLSADLVSNYPLTSLNVQAVYVPKNGRQPDEHILDLIEYKHIDVDSSDGNPIIEMPDMKLSLEQTVDTYANGVLPTHLLLSDPLGTFTLDAGLSRPVWVSFNNDEQSQITEKVKSLTAKANSGNTNAQLDLGMAYLDGKKISKSLYKARKWLTMAATKGNVKAAVQLGYLNIKRYNSYNSTPESFYWLTKAARTNDKVGQFALCQFYHDRYGFDDAEEGRKWCHKSAAQGHAPAMHYLGRIYEKGFSVEVGYKKALSFYQKAAAKGSAKSLANIARFYHLGLGVKQDTTIAYRYAKKALSVAKRDNLFVRNITQRIVADILLDEFSDVKSFKMKKRLITDKVFKEFSRDFIRMWIAQGLSNEWNGGNSSHHIAEAIINRQKKHTPELSEMLYAEAWVILRDGYYNGDQYDPVARNAAIRILEGLQNDDVLEFNVFTDLIYLYLSEKKPKKAENLIKKARLEKYFDDREVSSARADISQYRGIITKEMRFSDNPDDRDAVERRNAYILKNLDKWNEDHKKLIKANPTHAWTHGNYSSFLLYKKEDYEGAIIYGEKALKLMPYPMAQVTTGMAYMVKASQLYKDKSTRNKSKKYIKKALSYGIDQWYIKDNCRKFCADISLMIKEYKSESSKKPI